MNSVLPVMMTSVQGAVRARAQVESGRTGGGTERPGANEFTQLPMCEDKGIFSSTYDSRECLFTHFTE